jgi:hypothetical protein
MRALAVLALLLVAAGCQTRAERRRGEIREVAQVSDPAMAAEAVARYLWTGGSYEHLPVATSDGTALIVTSRRTDHTSFLRDVNRFRAIELRAHAARIFRTFRTLGPEHPLDEVRVTVILEIRRHEEAPIEPWEYLRFGIDREAIERVEGYAETDPWGVDSTDHWPPAGEAFLERIVESFEFERDGTEVLTLE